MKTSTGQLKWAWIFTALSTGFVNWTGGRGQVHSVSDHIKSSAFQCFTTQMELKTYPLKPWWISALKLSVSAAASCDNEQHSHLWVENKLRSCSAAPRRLNWIWKHPQMSPAGPCSFSRLNSWPRCRLCKVDGIPSFSIHLSLFPHPNCTLLYSSPTYYPPSVPFFSSLHH